ncbi:MAG: hypothetical protein JW829_00215 [Pirellulales bacterium]|nr:hypothetical protein [Pirellulales bacterium]
MRATDLCPSPHMEAADLGDKDVKVTIQGVSFDEVGEEKKTKGIIHFEEFDRGFVVNRTNLKRIMALHGPETNEWIGKKITLYPSETDFAGKTVPCIRVREKKHAET